MINYFSNLIHLVRILMSLFFHIRKQRRFVRKTLAVDIANSRKINDNSLDEHDYKKMNGYYGVAVPAILGESYCLLRGRSMSSDERYSITYLGACTGLFDDFFDKRHLPAEYIRTLIDNPFAVTGNTNNETIFLEFYKKALLHATDSGLVKQYAFDVFEAQLMSKKQLLSGIETHEIKNITIQKGGSSLLLYRSTFSEKMSDEEIHMLKILGGIGQLENDIFDVYKDHKSGVNTLATTTSTIGELRQTYMSLMHDVFELVHKTPYARSHKLKFLRTLSLVISRGLVCLDFLEKNESSTNHSFKIGQYQRHDLVCDMGKPVHFLKSIHYYARTNINKS
jgi:hypothetical protein